MKRLIFLVALISTAAFAQSGKRAIAPNDSFASDLQTLPVVANTTGFNGAQFISYVALYNPTASSFPVTASFFDANGTKKDAVITLAAGELRTYTNFLADVFNAAGGGAATLTSGNSNNRFIVSSEVRTGRFSTTVPALEFAGSSSQSFAPGITVDSTARTNVGCFNQSSAANTVKANIFSGSGQSAIGSVTLNLAPNAWGQAAVTTIVSSGVVQFVPSDNAVCYAVVVDNSTNDGRFISAAEYRP
jgi:hypothetical protein